MAKSEQSTGARDASGNRIAALEDSVECVYGKTIKSAVESSSKISSSDRNSVQISTLSPNLLPPWNAHNPPHRLSIRQRVKRIQQLQPEPAIGSTRELERLQELVYPLRGQEKPKTSDDERFVY